MILHGYHLDGSGSCVYVANIAQEFAEAGTEVILLCQEPEPEKYDFISEAYEITEDGGWIELFKRPQKAKGTVIYVRPYLKDRLLPVFVPGKFPGFENVKAFTELSDAELQSYVDTNVEATLAAASKFEVQTVFANHIVMTPYIAVKAAQKNPSLEVFLIPHGSEIEYLIKKDKKFHAMAVESLSGAKGIISGSEEMLSRMKALFSEYSEWENKIRLITIGVNSEQFSSPLSQSKADRVAGLKAEIQKQLDQSTSSIDNADPEFLQRLDQIDFESSKILVNFGKLIPGKGVQDILFAAPALFKLLPQTHLIIAGDGKGKSFFKSILNDLQSGDLASFRERLQSEREAYQDGGEDPFQFIDAFLKNNDPEVYFMESSAFEWKDRVHFTGYIKHPSLKFLLCLGDVALFPSIVKEAYPLALLEALAAGTFPVASNWGGLKDGLKQVEDILDSRTFEITHIPMDPSTRIDEIIRRTQEAVNSVQPDTRQKVVQHIQKTCSWRKVCTLLESFFTES